MRKDSSAGKIALTICAFSFYMWESSVCMNFKVIQKEKKIVCKSVRYWSMKEN